MAKRKYSAQTRKRIASAKENGTRLGRKPLPPGEKKISWGRRVMPDVITKMDELATELIMSDTEVMEEAIREKHARVFKKTNPAKK